MTLPTLIQWLTLKQYGVLSGVTNAEVLVAVVMTAWWLITIVAVITSKPTDIEDEDD